RRVLRVYAHHTFLSEQIAAVEAERRAQLQASTDAKIDKVRQLMLLKGIGINGAWLLVMEFFGWRAFKNRREVGGLESIRKVLCSFPGFSAISKSGHLLGFIGFEPSQHEVDHAHLHGGFTRCRQPLIVLAVLSVSS